MYKLDNRKRSQNKTRKVTKVMCNCVFFGCLFHKYKAEITLANTTIIKLKKRTSEGNKNKEIC